LRIYIFIGDFRFGGAEVVGVNLANSYVNLGHQVTIIVLRNRGKLRLRLKPEVEILSLENNLVFSLPALGNLLKKIYLKPHLIVSTIRTLNILLGLANYIWCHDKARIVMREANTYLQLRNGSINDRILFFLYKRVIPWTYKRAHRVIANSKDTLTDIFSFIKVKEETEYVCIGNPVILSRTPPSINTMDCDAEKPTGIPNIVCVGRLHRQKDFALAIKSVHVFTQKYFEVSLTIYGEGNQYDYLSALARDLGVTLSIKTPTNDLTKIFKDADLFLLTSQWEGFGNVIVEAMYYGVTPVVVDCRGGPKEIVAGRYGYVASRSTECIANTLEWAIKNKIPKAVLLNRSQDFNANKIAKKYIECIPSSF
jgi:glycosyltransferase involved in cell wall biosynthesis